MNGTITSIDPFVLLNEVFEIDQLAAVRIANAWGGASSTPEQTDAAWGIAMRQTVLPVCIECRWPVVEDDPHHFCIGRLLAAADNSDNDDLSDEADDCDASPDDDSDIEDPFDAMEDYDDSDNEDPLAGDVDPTGGYYEPPIHPMDAHRLEVMRQHGDYTG